MQGTFSHNILFHCNNLFTIFRNIRGKIFGLAGDGSLACLNLDQPVLYCYNPAIPTWWKAEKLHKLSGYFYKNNIDPPKYQLS